MTITIDAFYWNLTSKWRWRRASKRLKIIIVFFFVVVVVNVNERRKYFTPSRTVINPMPFKVLYPDLVQCPEKPPLVTIMVASLHQHRKSRQVIRETWGNQASHISDKVMVVFLLGINDDMAIQAEAKEEAERMRDMVMFNFRESYFNLTYKVLMGFKWIKDFCPQTKYVIKVDDDVLLNIPSILEKIRYEDWTSEIVGVYVPIPHVQRTGKHAVSFSAYPFLFYPPYVRGCFYFMPTDLALEILDVSYYFRYLNIEDVFITGILAKAVGGVNYKDIQEDAYLIPDTIKDCTFMEPPRFAVCDISPDQGRLIWQKHNMCKNQINFKRQKL